MSKWKEINCGGTDHTSLHRSRAPLPSAHPVVPLAESRDLTPVIEPQHTSCHSTSLNRLPSSNLVLLSVIRLRVTVGDTSLMTFALLDTGSEVSLIRENVALSLGLKGPMTLLRLGTFYGSDPIIQTTKVNFRISSIDKVFQYDVTNALSVPRLNRSQRVVDNAKLKMDWPPLKNIESHNINGNQVTMLIGIDVFEAHQQVSITRPPENQKALCGLLTPFGWYIVGCIHQHDTINMQVSHVHVEPMDDVLNDQAERFWKIESFVIKPNVKLSVSKKDQRAMDSVFRRFYMLITATR